MLSPKHKFIFVHVPKTAGFSITSRVGGSVGHRPLSFILKKRSEYEGYLKFSFVRNPWDRAVSAFHYMQRRGTATQNEEDYRDFKKYFSEPQSFEEFIKSNIFNSVIDNQQHFKAMNYYLDGNLDFIGRFENLQEDFNTMCDKIGIPQQQLPHHNKTQTLH